MKDAIRFWNYLVLPTPVIISNKVLSNNPNKVVVDLKLVMNQIMKTLDNLTLLHLEAATLSRLIYRTKHKFRQEKSFKALQKINRCLTNYLTMHFSFTLSTIRDTLHNDTGPTRQMMEWALTRLIGVANLFHRVYSLCMDAAGHLYVRIKLAHVLDITVFSLATVSRIWTFSQFVVRHACEWYKILYQYMDKLQPGPAPWLPHNCVLPQDLTKSLGSPAYLSQKNVSKPSNMLSQFNVRLPEEDRAKVTKHMSAVIDLEILDDIGESIPRDVFHNNLGKDDLGQNSSLSHIKNKKSGSNRTHNEDLVSNKKNKKRKRKKVLEEKVVEKYEHDVKSITSSETLLKFIEIESALRNLPSQSKKSKKMDETQWKVQKKMIENKIPSLKGAESHRNPQQKEQVLKFIRKKVKKWVS